MDVVLLVLLLKAASSTGQESAEVPRLWVELVETTGLDENVIAALQKEVESIYRFAGVGIHWLDASPAQTAPYTARVYVMDILPLGLDRRLRTFNGAAPMALGFGDEGGVSGPVLYVSRQAVVAKATSGALVDPEPEALARALGRVIAHELAHRFLQRKHTRGGVLKADLSSSDLVDNGSWARFTKCESERLRRVAASGSQR